jgi:ribosomal protein S18 acetylase RimI-like enzyme
MQAAIRSYESCTYLFLSRNSTHIQSLPLNLDVLLAFAWENIMADITNGATSPSPPSSPFRIDFATTPQDLKDIAVLFLEYTSSLGIDLAYQSFAEELAGLPGKYASPHGVLLIARSATPGANAKPIGCVALRPLPVPGGESAGSRCELKRLYVRSDARGTGLGEALVKRALGEAVARGYGEVVMDTLELMTPARRLYTKLGFSETTAYYETPIKETIFYRRALP